MTEIEFKQRCKKEKIKSYCYITTTQFLKIPNILGCNKTEKEFIIYSTNRHGTVNEICKLNDENYTFDFIYKILICNQVLNIGKDDKVKTKAKTMKM